MMRGTIDTNIFVYAVDARDASKQAAAIELIERLREKDCFVSLQTIGELYAALTRRLKRAPWEAAQASRNILAAFPSFGSSRTVVERALAEAFAGRFSYWDAHQLAAAHEAGCRWCFSEDMTDGAKLGDVEVVRPFAAKGELNARARAILDAPA
jgi:predicted nucleic acid-binding protein